MNSSRSWRVIWRSVGRSCPIRFSIVRPSQITNRWMEKGRTKGQLRATAITTLATLLPGGLLQASSRQAHLKVDISTIIREGGEWFCNPSTFASQSSKTEMPSVEELLPTHPVTCSSSSTLAIEGRFSANTTVAFASVEQLPILVSNEKTDSPVLPLPASLFSVSASATTERLDSNSASTVRWHSSSKLSISRLWEGNPCVGIETGPCNRKEMRILLWTIMKTFNVTHLGTNSGRSLSSFYFPGWNLFKDELQRKWSLLASLFMPV